MTMQHQQNIHQKLSITSAAVLQFLQFLQFVQF
jgi:hypothetical protein